MNNRALTVFTVSYAGIRFRVRVLPHAKDVYAELTGGAKWRMCKELPEGFFLGNVKGKLTGTVVLAGNSNLDEIVPHEVFHGVMHHFKTVHTDNDEPAAYAIGVLTRKILAKIGNVTLKGE